MQRINNIIVPKSTNNTQSSPKINNQNKGLNFQEILNQKVNRNTELKISKHAEERLKSRNIKLTKEQMDRVNDAVSKAEAKGVKESLVLIDDTALVVSIKNRTIITAVDSKELKDNVFTNIDGAVII